MFGKFQVLTDPSAHHVAPVLLEVMHQALVVEVVGGDGQALHVRGELEHQSGGFRIQVAGGHAVGGGACSPAGG